MTAIYGTPPVTDVWFNSDEGTVTIVLSTTGPLSNSTDSVFFIEFIDKHGEKPKRTLRARFDSTRSTWVDLLDENDAVIRDFKDVRGEITFNASHVTFTFSREGIDLPVSRRVRISAWSTSNGNPTDTPATVDADTTEYF
ncbi:hypothetical protein M2390_003138 [Mycetocola sp. BIGb0189]|uniref:hypothetical protein n=1 Tax=Mycetocola sp. BIGb0189 TaxID=2940604 RepID=UPI002168E24A|nr:hypothetical protein [Mycetocola sp. BIGb0189]MCS4277922.1 hypothetical protein [Mycetocola sp. BIGb0189]